MCGDLFKDAQCFDIKNQIINEGYRVVQNIFMYRLGLFRIYMLPPDWIFQPNLLRLGGSDPASAGSDPAGVTSRSGSGSFEQVKSSAHKYYLISRKILLTIGMFFGIFKL